MRYAQLLLVLSIALCFTCHFAQAQQIVALSQSTANPGQSAIVTIEGINTHFKKGATQIVFGNGITVQNITVTSATSATASILVSSQANLGTRDVVINTGSERISGGSMFSVVTPTGGAVTAFISLLPIETINLKNIDITQPASTPVLFYADVHNDDVKRIVTITVTVSNSQGTLCTLSLKNQSLLPNVQIRYSNRDFTMVKFNGALGQTFLAQLENSGTFSPDNYTFRISVSNNGATTVLGSDAASATVANQILNPQLITPGMSYSSAIPNVYIPNPLFQWFGQNDKYDFALYANPNGESQDEVVRNLPIYQKKDVTGNSLLYPSSAKQLEDGKQYAWQILGKRMTATGIQYMPSEVFRFTYTAPGKGKSIVSSIRITPSEITLSPGQQYKFAAIYYDLDGEIIQSVTPVWQVTPAQGSISQDGTYTAGAAGSTVAIIVQAGTALQFAIVSVVAKK